MIDPAALGTLLIGLDRARSEFEPLPDHIALRRQRATPRRRRTRVAVALRIVALRLDRRRLLRRATPA